MKFVNSNVKAQKSKFLISFKTVLKEYREFFETYKNLEGKKVKVLGFMTRRVAYKLIREGIKAYEKKFKRKHKR